MIIIPEINAIYIRVPSNEDGKLTDAIMRKYASARPLYNQMESDGIPIEYKHFEKFGIIRDPIDRLWDFYNAHRNNEANVYSLAIYGPAAKRYDFENWLILNNACFQAYANPEKTRENGTLYGINEIIHHLPENHKSQYFYLSPTSGMVANGKSAAQPNSNGIMIFPYSHMNHVANALGIKEDVTPEELYGPAPQIESALVRDTVLPLFAWDFQMCENMRIAMLVSDNSKTA